MFCGPSRHKGLLSRRGSRHSASVFRVRVLGIGLPSCPRFVPSVPPPGWFGGTLFRAYRTRAGAPVSAGAVRAPDCARESADAPVLPAPAGAFSRPQLLSCAEKRKAAPGAASLFSYYHIFSHVKPPGGQNMKFFQQFFEGRDNRRRHTSGAGLRLMGWCRPARRPGSLLILSSARASGCVSKDRPAGGNASLDTRLTPLLAMRGRGPGRWQGRPRYRFRSTAAGIRRPRRCPATPRRQAPGRSAGEVEGGGSGVPFRGLPHQEPLVRNGEEEAEPD